MRFFFIGISALLLATSGHLYWLSRLNGPEVYPADTFLQTVTNKKALVVVAHDDDAIGCAGTITTLTKAGWEVHYLTFYGHYRAEDNPVRKKEATRAGEIQQMASVRLIDFALQRSDTVKAPWLPIPYAAFDTYFYMDSLRQFIAQAIAAVQPSVVFSLDNIIGGYGHPEHVATAQAVLDVWSANRAVPGYPVERVYQAVFPPTLNENILSGNPAFLATKDVYGAEGSPHPTTEIDITAVSKAKKQVMKTYKSQHRNLKKIWPYYHVYPHWIYFQLFDKEYFHVVSSPPQLK